MKKIRRSKYGVIIVIPCADSLEYSKKQINKILKYIKDEKEINWENEDENKK